LKSLLEIGRGLINSDRLSVEPEKAEGMQKTEQDEAAKLCAHGHVRIPICEWNGMATKLCPIFISPARRGTEEAMQGSAFVAD
jgi:hypothetical protein